MRTTSRTSGGGRWSASATTSWQSTPDPPAPAVWKASGHLEGFPIRWSTAGTAGFAPGGQAGGRAVWAQAVEETGRVSECDLTDAREFNLMFETHVGPVKDTASIAYLRPETAQGIFINFKNVLVRRRSRPSGSRRRASPSATRSRPETSSSARASSSRWRWSTSSRRTRRRSGTSTGWTSAWAGTRPRHRPANLKLRPHDATSSRTTHPRPRTWSICSRWAGRSSRGSRTGATST